MGSLSPTETSASISKEAIEHCTSEGTAATVGKGILSMRWCDHPFKRQCAQRVFGRSPATCLSAQAPARCHANIRRARKPQTEGLPIVDAPSAVIMSTRCDCAATSQLQLIQRHDGVTLVNLRRQLIGDNTVNILINIIVSIVLCETNVGHSGH